MKPNELRIGNLIDTGFGECLVNGITENGQVIQLNSDIIEAGWVLINDAKPILLNEEWLNKFGFKRDSSTKENWFWLQVENTDESECQIHINLNDYDWWVGVPYEAGGTSLKLKYVHQLQNLYYALVGMDLAVAPPCP